MNLRAQSYVCPRPHSGRCLRSTCPARLAARVAPSTPHVSMSSHWSTLSDAPSVPSPAVCSVVSDCTNTTYNTQASTAQDGRNEGFVGASRHHHGSVRGALSEGQQVESSTGATGNQGGSVLEHLVKSDKPYRIRAITRDAKKPAAQKLRDVGAETVEGDLADRASLEKAIEGSDIIFVHQSSVSCRRRQC